MEHVTEDILNLLSFKPNRKLLTDGLETIHLYNLLPYGYLTSGVADLVCKLFDGTLCNLIMNIFLTTDPKIDMTDRYDVFISYLPAGAGYKNYLHYADNISKKDEIFGRFDYDSKRKDKEHYGQDKPPAYDLSKIDFPIAIFGGTEDKLADRQDVDWLADQLKEHVIFY